MRTKAERRIKWPLQSFKQFRFNSLAFRLFATSAGWTVFALPLAGFILYYNYSQNVIFNFERSIRLHLFSIEAQNSEKNVPVMPEHLTETRFSFPNSGWYWQIQPLTNGQGPRLVSASLTAGKLPSPMHQGIPQIEDGLRKMDATTSDGRRVRLFEQIVRLSNNPKSPRYSFIVAGALDQEYAKISAFAWELTTALGLAALGLLIATFLQIHFGLFPLRSIEAGLSDIRSGKADKLQGRFPIEIEPLQSELNALIASNQDIIDRARTQVGNLAHALKTPLAVIVNEADEEDTAFARKVGKQAHLMHNQIVYHLDRARVAAQIGTIGRVCDVHTVTEPLKRALERIYSDKNVTIMLNGSEGKKFQGEQHDLEEILGNLLDNACKWCSQNVRVQVIESPSQSRLPPMLTFSIEDDGPGLTAEQRRKIGRRGVRLDETTPGTGLGLSIVNDLALSYRGTLEMDASELGGLKVMVSLPAAQKSS